MASEWTVYIIRCDDSSLYTGVTTDLARRFREHAAGARGARYFNGRKPLEVVYSESGHDRSSACRREAAIKKLGREGKLQLIRSGAERGQKRHNGASSAGNHEAGLQSDGHRDSAPTINARRKT